MKKFISFFISLILLFTCSFGLTTLKSYAALSYSFNDASGSTFVTGENDASLQSASAIRKNSLKVNSDIFSDDAIDYSNFDISLNVKYCQSEARKVVSLINEFRTGSDTWYWNSTNTEKVYVNGLSTLSYDYNLEKAAMQRAAEIALSFSHTRPDGRSCFTAYPEYWSGGENIAAGYGNSESVHIGWREDNEYYSYQGHRRNMLNKNWKAVGIGCVYYNGYYYWVEEFSSANLQPDSVPANNSYSDVTVQIATDQIVSLKLTAPKENYLLQIDESEELPDVDVSLKLSNAWPGYMCKGKVFPDWNISDTSVATITDGKITGLTSGNAQLTCRVFDKQLNIPISVENESVSEMSFTISETKYQYTGNPIKPEITDVKIGNKKLDNSEYTVTYKNNTAIGIATVTVSGKGKYIGYSCSQDFEIYCSHNIVVDKGKSPSCTETGLTDGSHCSVCGEVFSEQSAIPATGHQYEYDIPRYPSCESTGIKRGICIKCGDAYTEVIPANGHRAGETQIYNNKPATCINEGSYLEVVNCSICGKELSTNYVKVPKLQHQYTSKTTLPTCTSRGYTTYTCKVCGSSYTDNYVSASGHTADSPIVENYIAPTRDHEGSYDNVIYCKICSAELSRNTVVVPIVECPHQHIVQNETVIKKASCNESGVKVITESCSDCKTIISQKNETIPKIAHQYSQSVKENMIPATCTHKGSYDEVIYCSVCGTELSRVSKSTAMVSHQWNSGVITKQATTSATGLKTYTCKKCGEQKTEVIPKKTANSKNGWFREGKNLFYYINGTKAKGWQKINNNWYLLANDDGRMLKGWQKVSGKWYYLNNSGIMQIGWQKISGKWYYLNSSGVMQTGWLKSGNKWYYLNNSGVMQTGWLKLGGKWYYLTSSGAMLANTSQRIGKKTYYFNSSGVCTNP